MTFQKGNKLRLGMKNGSKQKEAVREYMKNRVISEETRAKMSMALKGKSRPEKIGVKFPYKERPSMSVRMKGDKNPNWKGGKGTERHKLMQQKEYILWRTAVFVRDDYTCQNCLLRCIELNADHIKPWALYPELRYAIDNGRTLCVDCHRQTDTWGYSKIYRKESD